MQVAIIITNFNNSHFTADLIESINSQKNRDVNLIVLVVDNCSEIYDLEHLDFIASKYKFVKIIKNTVNVGYFKGLNIGLSYLRENFTSIKYFIIGNNDLVFSDLFLDQLIDCKELLNKYPVISPDIVTIDGIHQNPHVIKKISKFREFIYDLYYYNYNFSKIILFISKITKVVSDRSDEKHYVKESEIYQGHGSCYILGPKFLDNFNELFAPTFLMSEEFFLSYQLKQKNFNVFYTPLIQVTHFGHASLKNVPSKHIWDISRDSHKIYKKYLKLYNNL